MKVKQNTRNSHTVSFESLKRKANFRIALLSDLHWDNPDCDRELLKKHLDYCLENDIKVLLNGDTFCLMQGKYDPRSSKGKVRPEHQNPRYLDAVIETAAEWFAPYAEIIIAVGYGNHEASILRRQETDVIQRFVALLNAYAKPENSVYAAGYTSCLRINCRWSTKSSGYDILYFHGSGGGGVVTRGEINLTRLLTAYEGFDMYTIGHVHELKETNVRTTYRNATGKLCGRDVLLTITGTYKDEYKEGYMGWHVERGAPNKPIGGKILEINWHRKDSGIEKVARTYNFPMV
jgi:predicted phosphodiesterase